MEFHILVQTTRSCARGVLCESTPRLLFLAVTIEQHVSLILFIQMYVARCLRHLWPVVYTMLYSLMTSHGSLGFCS
jgi:hypothetical protein